GIEIVERDRRIVACSGQVGLAEPPEGPDLDGDHTDGVAIGGRLRDRRMADHAAAACTVNDIEGLLEFVLQHLGDDAACRVGAAAGCPGHNHLYRPFGPCRICRCCCRQNCQGTEPGE